jgi:hypothetical protein
MKLALWKRTLLGALVAVSVAGASLTSLPAAQAATGGGGTPCPTVPTGPGEACARL